MYVKRTGKQQAKLDKHDFVEIFLGYPATTKNIRYLDLLSGMIKNCGHATFDEAWYSESARPPAAQLIYDLGLVVDSDLINDAPPSPLKLAPPPPIPTRCPPPKLTPLAARHLPLPLRLTEAPPSIAARAARMTREQRWAQVQDPYKNTVLAGVNPDGSALDRYDITKRDITQVFFSPDPYHNAVEETIDLRRYVTFNKHAGGMVFRDINGRLILADILKSSPAARIPCWRTRMRGA